MKILISDPTSADALEKLKNAGFELVEKTEKKTPEELADIIEEFDAIVVRSATKVRKVAIDKAKNLKLIVRGGVGLDNIDVEYAEEKGIKVFNTPAASSASVAELAIGFMFAMARFIPQATITMKNGEWNKKAYKGTELAGKTLGLMGCGRIGSNTAFKAMALGMHVISYDPYISDAPVEGIKLVEKDELLKNADIISMHVPFKKGQKPIIGKEEFDKMKDGVFIVNAARGGCIDEKALLDALNSGKVAKAAIDVYEEEPTDNMELVKHPNVICSPHIGAQTAEAQARVGIEVADILIRELKK